NLVGPVIQPEIYAQQTYRNSWRLLNVTAALDPNVRGMQFAEHIVEDRVDLLATGTALQQLPVLLANSNPIHVVQPGIVEEIPAITPCFRENLPPLFARVD